MHCFEELCEYTPNECFVFDQNAWLKLLFLVNNVSLLDNDEVFIMWINMTEQTEWIKDEIKDIIKF